MSKLILCAAFTLTLMFISTNGLDNIHERCTVQENVGITVDSCDGSKFISCQNGRCACNDQANQIYTYKIETVKRQKRGLGKKLAIGAGGAFVGYQVAKATSGGGHSSNDRESSSKKKVYACYGLVGAPCAMDYNNVNIVLRGTNSTTEHFQNETNHESNTTTVAPVIFDLQKLTKCVYHAVCKPRNANNSTNIKTNDPRVGVCTCDTGFKRTTTDICESKAYYTIPSLLVIISSVLIISRNMFFS